MNRRELLTNSGRALALGAFRGPLHAQTQPAQPFPESEAQVVVTTARSPWQQGSASRPSFDWDLLNLNISADFVSRPIAGFGACFNELGWVALQTLHADDRAAVMKELFDPEAGARFSLCRMPIGANDFSTAAYSYDEVDGDFALQHFSIAHDKVNLLPFIRAAQQHRPDLRLWASPWTPPSWMKRNDFYAEAPAGPGQKDNGIRPDQIGKEGEDTFIQEPRYFDAYARYFGKFIDAYRAEGVRVDTVMPQNEFNSAQSFPSCTWTPAGLGRFIQHLGPEMQKRDVAVFFGTLERGNPELVKTVMAEPGAAKFIQGLGVQWAGKNALPALAEMYPQLPIWQSEQECGNGENAWSYTAYCWELMKHYFRSGASAWMYWNIALMAGQPSTWGWRQNSLVSVADDGRYRYTSDYYLLKHLTHFVRVGARRVKTSGTADDALAFQNPDHSTAVVLRNPSQGQQKIQIALAGSAYQVELPADSIATVLLRSGVA